MHVALAAELGQKIRQQAAAGAPYNVAHKEYPHALVHGPISPSSRIPKAYGTALGE
jgi:hypothetical protein